MLVGLGDDLDSVFEGRLFPGLLGLVGLLNGGDCLLPSGLGVVKLATASIGDTVVSTDIAGVMCDDGRREIKSPCSLNMHA